MTRIWSVLQCTTNASRVAIQAAGATHAIIDADWVTMQPSATGSLDSTATTNLLAAYAHALSIGLKPILSVNLHYTPTWVQTGVEKFTDQSSNAYDTNGSGSQVRNWVWTATGRTYVADLVSRIATALGSTNVAATDGCRLGGGVYGELHYPTAVSGGPTYAWYGFGTSMQSGTGLASDQVVCPLPGYVPYSGTDAQDSAWLNWYLNGLVTWGLWEVAQFKAAGFTRNLWMLLPGYGIRDNNVRSDSGYKQAAACGEDHTRAIAAFMHDPAVWPYCTWLNTVDGYAGGTNDTDKAAWKSIYEKARVRGKHHNMVGENTGGESNSGMDGIFSGALAAGTYAGSPGTPTHGFYYKGCAWLSYSTLTAGGSAATMAEYQTDIAAAAAGN